MGAGLSAVLDVVLDDLTWQVVGNRRLLLFLLLGIRCRRLVIIDLGLGLRIDGHLGFVEHLAQGRCRDDVRAHGAQGDLVLLPDELYLLLIIGVRLLDVADDLLE